MKCCANCCIFGSTTQSIFSEKLLKRDLTQRLTTWLAWITSSITPATDTSRGRSLSFKRFANSFVMKFIWESLSSNARHEWIWLLESYTWIIAVDSKIFNERWPDVHCVATGSGGLVAWPAACVFDCELSELFGALMCNNVLCFLLHFRHILELHAFTWCMFDLKGV